MQQQLKEEEKRGDWFLVFGLLCRHTASNSISSETHTSGTESNRDGTPAMDFGCEEIRKRRGGGETECLLYDSHQKGKLNRRGEGPVGTP